MGIEATKMAKDDYMYVVISEQSDIRETLSLRNTSATTCSLAESARRLEIMIME